MATLITRHFEKIILALVIIYTALTLSPSSYHIALREMGVYDHGPWFGHARPIRSDEWSVWTPYVQIAVNNQFARYNQTSLYHEDLRNFNAVPLWDWALPFKPQFWLFFMVDPAHAYAFYFAFIWAAFILGYFYLLRIGCGLTREYAALGALLLYFCAFSQMWWTTAGPNLAFFPWVILAALVPTRIWMRFVLMTYAATCWLIGQLYPPMLVSLAFVGMCILLPHYKRLFKPLSLFCMALASATSVGLAFLYFADVIPEMMQTVHPGGRLSSGGGIEYKFLWSQIFPFINHHRYNSLIQTNICEISTVGSYLLIVLLCFYDYSKIQFATWRNRISLRGESRLLSALLLGLFAMSCWIFLPIPSALGRVFLWHRVPPQRMVFAWGLTITLLGLILFQMATFKFTWARWRILVVVTAIFPLATKFHTLRTFDFRSIDGLIAVMMGVDFWLHRKNLSHYSAFRLLSCIVLCNIAGFFSFNPLQSTKPIFERPTSARVQEFNTRVATHPQHILLAPEVHGAVANGWGFRSAGHVLVRPQLEFFRKLFPDLDHSEFNFIFNRYAHIYVRPLSKPELMQTDVVLVPEGAF